MWKWAQNFGFSLKSCGCRVHSPRWGNSYQLAFCNSAHGTRKDPEKCHSSLKLHKNWDTAFPIAIPTPLNTRTTLRLCARTHKLQQFCVFLCALSSQECSASEKPALSALPWHVQSSVAATSPFLDEAGWRAHPEQLWWRTTAAVSLFFFFSLSPQLKYSSSRTNSLQLKHWLTKRAPCLAEHSAQHSHHY